MKNVFKALFVVCFSLVSFMASAQDYVSPKEAVTRIESKMEEWTSNVNPNRPSFEAFKEDPLGYSFHVLVRNGILEDPSVNFDVTIDKVFNQLTDNGVSKLTSEAEGIRTEIIDLIQD